MKTCSTAEILTILVDGGAVRYCENDTKKAIVYKGHFPEYWAKPEIMEALEKAELVNCRRTEGVYGGELRCYTISKTGKRLAEMLGRSASIKRS